MEGMDTDAEDENWAESPGMLTDQHGRNHDFIANAFP